MLRPIALTLAIALLAGLAGAQTVIKLNGDIHDGTQEIEQAEASKHPQGHRNVRG